MGDVKDIRIVGSGGNINKLIRLTDRKSTELSVDTRDSLYHQMSGLTVDELMEKYDLKESRADVIVHAARLFLTVAEIVGASTIIVPSVGLADSIINMMAVRLCLPQHDRCNI